MPRGVFTKRKRGDDTTFVRSFKRARKAVVVVKKKDPTAAQRWARVALGFPKDKMVKLRYAQEFNINPGIGSFGFHYFRCNSMFDPDLTGTGHQPLYYDQYIAAYDHYTVHGAKIKVTYVHSGSAPQTPGYMGIFVDDNATPSYASAGEVLERGQKTSDWTTTAGNSSGNRNMPSVTLNFDAKKFFGVKSLDGAQFRVNWNANPTENANFCCWLASIGGNDPAIAYFMVEIEYYALLSEKTYVGQS